MQKLNPLAFGLAAGIFWGVMLGGWTLLGYWTGYGREILELITQIYPGYSVSLIGSCLGLVYGFLDGFVACVLFAWLYNRLAK